MSLGQGGSLRPGNRSHHEHHERPSLPREHPAGYRTARRWKHNHPGQKVLSAPEYLLPLLPVCISALNTERCTPLQPLPCCHKSSTLCVHYLCECTAYPAAHNQLPSVKWTQCRAWVEDLITGGYAGCGSVCHHSCPAHYKGSTFAQFVKLNHLAIGPGSC